MGSDFKSLPIIDIASLVEKADDPNMTEDERVLKVVRHLDEACKEAGFFYVVGGPKLQLRYFSYVATHIRKGSTDPLGWDSFIKGHGIPDSLINEAREVTRKFFDLPYQEKQKIKLSSTTGYRGFQSIGGNLTYGTPDFHEAINSYREVGPGEYGSLGGPIEGPNLWPDTPSNFKSLMEQYSSLLKELSRKIMRGLAVALGGPAEAFEGDISGDAFWMMRLIGYPGLSEGKSPDIKCSDSGCDAHTDLGILSFLNQTEDVNALQVRNRSGDWINAIPVPGTFVCVLGEMLKILSNGIYEATVHKVLNSSPMYRVSVAFFYETNFDKHVEPSDFCVQKTGKVAKYEGTVYGKHLIGHLVNNLVVDN